MLDLFACEGCGTSGYQRAGWHVTAVDLDKNRLRYNPADEWHQWDALDFVRENFEDFDAIHASPPCQGYTRGNAGKVTPWPKLIPAVREALADTGKPYVIENVEDAAWDMKDPIPLCGCMFDLKTVDTDGITIHLQRLRLFETNWGLESPRPCDHSAHEWVAGAYGGARRDKYEAKYVRKGGYVPPDKSVVQRLLGVEHRTTWKGLFESIPPAYTEYVGVQLLRLMQP
jgi:DNA (cytosine-5)-methyltransferase 1